MGKYEDKVIREIKLWQQKMSRKPSITGRLTKGIQRKVNNLIPEKVHKTITAAIKNMVQAVLIGSEFITKKPILHEISLEELEKQVLRRASYYKKGAAASGAGTGAGGILLGLADFPILLTLKIKFLFDTASLYGFDVTDFKERLYILHLFELAFSSREKRVEVYERILNWDKRIGEIPLSMENFDWRSFQQEYRDYIDLAKMLQLVPVIGSVVGAVANYRLMDKLKETAINGYRLRLLHRGDFDNHSS
ncbi:MAG: EcsC family protein [Carboxydocellales bacterium]